VTLNTEIGLVFESPELASQAAAQLLAAVSASAYRLELVPAQAAGDSSRHIEWIEQDNEQEVRHESEPNAGIWRRFGVWVLSWLPIESQL
jgi:putative cardiolipin synthase